MTLWGLLVVGMETIITLVETWQKALNHWPNNSAGKVNLKDTWKIENRLANRMSIKKTIHSKIKDSKGHNCELCQRRKEYKEVKCVLNTEKSQGIFFCCFIIKKAIKHILQWQWNIFYTSSGQNSKIMRRHMIKLTVKLTQSLLKLNINWQRYIYHL